MTNYVSQKHGDESGIYKDPKTLEDLTATNFHPKIRSNARAVQFSDETATTTSELTRSRNLPKLQPPEFSTLNLINLLKEFQRNNSVSDVKTSMLDATRLNSDLDQHKAADIENKATLQAQQVAEDKTTASKKVLNWILAIGGLILGVIAVCLAGAALTVATAGAGAPAVIIAVVLLVGAVVGLLAGAIGVTNLILQEVPKRTNVFGEKVSYEISLTALIDGLEELDVASGRIKIIGVNATSDTPGAITRKQFDKNKEDRTFAINVAFASVMLLFCIGSLAYAFRAATTVVKTVITVVEDTAKAAEMTAQTASRAQLIASMATAAGSAFMAVGSGFNAYLSIRLGLQKNDRSNTMIIGTTIEAAIQTLQQQFDASQQHFRSAMNFQDKLRTRISSLIAEFIDTSITIAKNTKV